MPQEFQGPASFLHGLSDLWLRFFKDVDRLKPVYRGTEILVGQAYLELMSTVLNISVRETPVFNREWFKLLTVREDQVSYDATSDRYVLELPDNIKDFDYLHNQIFGPTVILQKELDFDIDTSGEEDELRFLKNPFDWTGSGDLIPGVAFRIVSVLQDDGSEVDYRQLAFWIPEAQVDRFNLYLRYGYLLDRFEPSSESYRALLQGIMRYFMLGPTFDYMVSALNVVVGLPLVREDGEVLQSVDRTADDDYDLVITNRNTYYFKKGMPFRDDIEDISNWGSFTLDAFEYLTSVFIAKDHVSNPEWWYNIVIPQQMLPDEIRARRILVPDLYDNLINNPEGLVKIGDPGFFIGADEDGFVPTGRPSKRHLFSYITFERFLRHHIYTVEIDRDALNAGLVPYPRTSEDIQQIIIAGASAYLFLYLEPDITLEDAVLFLPDTDELQVKVQAEIENVIGAVDGVLTIGLKSWKIGDYYKYGTTDMTIVNESVTPFTPNTVDTWVVIGGADPYHLVQLVYDTNVAGGSVTVTVHESEPGWRVVSKSLAGGPAFDGSDVSRFVRIGIDDAYYQVLDVRDEYTLVTDGGNLRVGQRLVIWQYEGSEESMGIVDWPVQVRVIP